MLSPCCPDIEQPRKNVCALKVSCIVSVMFGPGKKVHKGANDWRTVLWGSKILAGRVSDPRNVHRINGKYTGTRRDNIDGGLRGKKTEITVGLWRSHSSNGQNRPAAQVTEFHSG